MYDIIWCPRWCTMMLEDPYQSNMTLAGTFQPITLSFIWKLCCHYLKGLQQCHPINEKYNLQEVSTFILLEFIIFLHHWKFERLMYWFHTKKSIMFPTTESPPYMDGLIRITTQAISHCCYGLFVMTSSHSNRDSCLLWGSLPGASFTNMV